MELVFLALLVLIMAVALGSGYPVAFALPGAAIVSIAAATVCGYLFAGDPGAYFAQGDGGQWLSAGVLNLRGGLLGGRAGYADRDSPVYFHGYHAAAIQDC